MYDGSDSARTTILRGQPLSIEFPSEGLSLVISFNMKDVVHGIISGRRLG